MFSAVREIWECPERLPSSTLSLPSLKRRCHSKSYVDNVSLPYTYFNVSPVGGGKMFVIKLLIEIYNRYTDNDGYCQSCKAAVAILGTTVHKALKMSLTRLLPLHSETA
ncbi:ATP-dependent DNA helicase [Trichonephila clavipes]|nr:ATP-dependent DNA helicase [Trichonephila clavipes]